MNNEIHFKQAASNLMAITAADIDESCPPRGQITKQIRLDLQQPMPEGWRDMPAPGSKEHRKLMTEAAQELNLNYFDLGSNTGD